MDNKEALKELISMRDFLMNSTEFVKDKDERKGVKDYIEALGVAIQWGKNEQKRKERLNHLKKISLNHERRPWIRTQIYRTIKELEECEVE